MMNATPPAASRIDADAVFKLKSRDNWTNWLYLARVWLFVAAAIATGSVAEAAVTRGDISGWWLLPVFVVTTLIIGASQHQLGGAIHEATHFVLFADKRLNELASDWLAAFPIYTSTYQYRVHHLAHHQFVNDPARDPDIAQLKDSDHWLDFPVTHVDVLRKLLKQLWLPALMRFTLVRARYSAVGHDDNPYIEKGARPSKVPVYVGIYFAVAVPIIAGILAHWPGGALPPLYVVASYAGVIAYYALIADAAFPQSRLKPVISHRRTTIGRMTFFFAVYGLLAFEGWRSGATWGWDHFGLYWVVPLFTSFPLFMMLRQWVQHGNADRGRYTNTRVFLAGPLGRYAVFPWGMDYHLPHHLMASVPHYNLKRLHQLLLEDPVYAQKGVVVDGYLGPDNPRTGRPTVMSVLGKDHAPAGHEAAYVDNAALEYADVSDAAAVAREADASRQGAGRP